MNTKQREANIQRLSHGALNRHMALCLEIASYQLPFAPCHSDSPDLRGHSQALNQNYQAATLTWAIGALAAYIFSTTTRTTPNKPRGEMVRCCLGSSRRNPEVS